jgi:hypothetical protein
MEDFFRAQLYRAEAKRLREKAANVDSAEIRQAYEDMAIRWELLAKELESAAKHPLTGKAPFRRT